MAHRYRALDPRYFHATFVGLLKGRVVATAFIGRDSWAHYDGKFIIDLQVEPAYRGRGVGRRIYIPPGGDQAYEADPPASPHLREAKGSPGSCEKRGVLSESDGGTSPGGYS